MRCSKRGSTATTHVATTVIIGRIRTTTATMITIMRNTFTVKGTGCTIQRTQVDRTA